MRNSTIIISKKGSASKTFITPKNTEESKE